MFRAICSVKQTTVLVKLFQDALWHHSQDPEISALIFHCSHITKKCIFGFLICHRSHVRRCWVKCWSFPWLCFYEKSYLLPTWELQFPCASKIWICISFSPQCAVLQKTLQPIQSDFSCSAILLNTIHPMWSFTVTGHASSPISSSILSPLLKQVLLAINTTSSHSHGFYLFLTRLCSCRTAVSGGKRETAEQIRLPLTNMILCQNFWEIFC